MLMLYYTMNHDNFSWKLIDIFFKQNPNFLVYHHLSSYDNFYFNRIHEILKSSNPTIFCKDFIELPNNKKGVFKHTALINMGGKDGKKLYYGKPIIYDEDNDSRQHFMYPNEARLRNMTYGISMFCDIDIDFEIYVEEIKKDDNNDEYKELVLHKYSETIKNVYLGRFPIMVQSKLCILKGLSKDVKYNMGECRNDPGGYFIINGKEKVLVSQERRRNNTLYVLHHEDAKYNYTCEIKSVSEDPSKPIRTLYIQYDNKNNNILVNIPNIRQSIPLFILMRALGIISDKEIIKACLLDLDKYENFIDLFIPSIHDTGKIFTRNLALKYISTFTKHQNIQNTLNVLMDYLLPHIGELNYKKKALYIGYMVKKLLLVVMGIEKPTDRDSYRFKSLEVSGISIEELFIEYYNLQMTNISKKLDYEYYFNQADNNYYEHNFKNIILNNKSVIFNDKVIEDGFNKAFKGNWGSTAHTKKLGILQDLSRLSFFSTICQLRKTNFPISAQGGKVLGPRLLNSTQWGFLCPLHSPDGGNVGLHNHMSCMLRISKGASKHKLIPLLKKMNMKFLEECDYLYLSITIKIFINGDWVGNTDEPLKIIEILKLLKHNNIIDIYTSIYFNIKHKELLISTEAGRLCRPLYYINNDNDSFNRDIVDKTLNNNKLTWGNIIYGFGKYKHDNLLDISLDNNNLINLFNNRSVIEYVDTEESEGIYIMNSNDDIVKYSNKYITNIEIHHSLILGFMANQIIFPSHNQYPRNAFSCGQSKQAVSMVSTNFINRMDKTLLILNNGESPLTKSRYYSYITNDEHPYGVNTIVAIMSYNGYNVEDAVIFNKGAIDRGLFGTTYYNCYEAHEEISSSGNSTSNKFFMNIINNEVYNINPRLDYTSLDDEYGIIKEGTIVNEKTVLIGLATEDPNNPGKYIDASIRPKKGQIGIVDKSFITFGKKGERIAKIRIRSIRIPEIGDKVCSRAGQKGTIGIILPEEDMPYTENGIRPDILVNPHAMPSRMTIGHLVECIFSKCGAINGNFQDCTAFVNKGSKHEYLGNILTTNGYHNSGKEYLYNGMTGELIDTDIYIGPTYYLRLKHMPKDKINYRARGPRTVLTRQTVSGRANDGGLRIGEMDRDCVIAHGLNNFLNESMLDRGDEYYMAVCNITGCIAIYNESKNIFLSPLADGPLKFNENLKGELNISKISKHGRTFSIVKVPYAFKLLMQELKTMNIQMRIITDDNVNNIFNLNKSIYELTNFKNLTDLKDNISKLINDNTVNECCTINNDSYNIDKNIDKDEVPVWVDPDKMMEDDYTNIGLFNTEVKLLDSIKHDINDNDRTTPDSSAFGLPDSDDDNTPDSIAFGLPDSDNDSTPDSSAFGLPDSDDDGTPNSIAFGLPDSDDDTPINKFKPIKFRPRTPDLPIPDDIGPKTSELPIKFRPMTPDTPPPDILSNNKIKFRPMTPDTPPPDEVIIDSKPIDIISTDNLTKLSNITNNNDDDDNINGNDKKIVIN